MSQESESSIWNFCKLPRELDEVTKDVGGSGFKVLTQLFLTYFLFCKAMSRDWVTLFSLTVYYTKVLAVDTNVANMMMTAATAPFGIKTLWGALSDALPCLGYNKRFYILWGVGVAILCMAGLYVLVDEGVYGENNPAPAALVFTATALFFGFEYGGATCDSLTQARYTELMKMMGKPTIVAFVWFLMNSCTLFSSWGNLWIKEGQYKILFVPAILAALPMLVPASMNWLAEPPAEHFCKPDLAKVVKHKGCFALSMVMAIGALTGTLLIMLQLKNSTVILTTFYFSMGVIFIVMSKFTLPSAIWGPGVYMFLCSALRLFFSATLQGFYTYRNEAGLPTETSDPCEGNPDPTCTSWCIRDGPGFSTSFYQLWGNFIGAIAAVFAVMIFDNVIVKWNVRPAFWVTTVFQMCSTMLEVSILERWNHIPFGTTPGVDQSVDQWFFLFGPLCIEKIVEMLDFMPCNVLIGNLCPKNMEATIFAVLAGSQNFGSNIARVMGAIAVENLGVNFPSNSNQCVNERVSWFFNLRGLSVARVAGGILLPAITVPLTFVMLPSKPLAEKYEDDDDGAVELREINEDAPTDPPERQGTVQGMVRTGTSMSALAMLSIASGGKVDRVL